MDLSEHVLASEIETSCLFETFSERFGGSLPVTQAEVALPSMCLPKPEACTW